MAHSSSRRCQSWFERARRDASKEKIAPTWLIATSPTSALKSSRWVIRAPDWPRSRSRTRIRSGLQPSCSALLFRLYCRSVLSWLKRLLHAGLPEILVAPQEFGVDGADLVERRAQPAEVVEELGGLATDGLRHIGLPRPLSGGADRQIVFWPVADPVGAMAARTTAASVGFHERAAEHTCERGNLRHEPAATLAQNCGRDVLHSERVQKMTDPIVVPAESSINPRRAATQNRLDEICERDEAGRVDDDRLDGRRHPRIRSRPIGPLAAHGEAAKIGMPEAQRLDPRNASKLQDDKPLAPQWMKRMRNFSRAQRLTGAKCSSMGVWQPSKTRWRN